MDARLQELVLTGDTYVKGRTIDLSDVIDELIQPGSEMAFRTCFRYADGAPLHHRMNDIAERLIEAAMDQEEES